MVRGAAGHDHDPPRAAQHLVVELGEVDAVGAGRAVGDRLGHCVRLLVDLLEHERLVAALLCLLGIPVDPLDRAVDGRAGGGEELDALGPDDDDLVVEDVLDVARVGEEGGDPGSEELLAVAAADDQRALLARADDHAGLVGGDGHEGVVAAQAVVGAADGLGQLAGLVELARDQVRHDLDVGLGGEVGAVGQELLLELHVVLHDPVDHDVHAVVGVEVRVRVLLGDAAVGGPARVADAGGGRRGRDGDAAAGVQLVRLVDGGAQRAQVADRADGAELALALDGDARRVVSAVLELLKPFEQDFLHRALSDVANDAAHSCPASFRSSSRVSYPGGPPF